MAMSGDALPAVFGVLVLLVAKFLAYSGFLHHLGRRWQAPRNPYWLALARIALGAALGALAWSLVPGDRGSFLGSYFGAIAAGRTLAWALVIGLAFGRNAPPHAIALAVAVGVVLSYVIEIPVALGIITAIGGIC
jgi:hypothetical protein